MRSVRAARVTQHGSPLEVQSFTPRDPGPDEVLVELAFGGVNPVDRYMADGRVAPQAPLPRTLGSEGSGELDGRAVLVAGEGLGAARDGVWAEAAVVPRAAIHELPEGLGLEEAAAMGVAGLTAWNVVFDLAQVSGQDRVLVLGASGGVGSMIVSLCRSLGATVWGQTGSSQKAQGIEEDGAQRALVGGPDDLAQALGELEPTVVFDPLGNGFLAPVVEALEPHGRVVSFGTSAGPEATFNLQTLYRKHASILGYAGMRLGREERDSGLEAALAAVRDGRMRVRIADILPLDHVNQALQRLADRGVQGNLLLRLA